MAWIALVMLDSFFSFSDELKKTNEMYSTSQAIIYLIFTLPSKFYNFFPTSILIGTLLGLGNLSANSEFVAMRAAGFSIGQIIVSIIKLGLILALFVFVMGEWLVPASDLQARNFKAHLQNKNITLIGGTGLWVKEKENIIHIGKVLASNQLSDISIYKFQEDFSQLHSLKTIYKARYKNETWQLDDIYSSVFLKTSVQKSHEKMLQDKAFLDPNILDIGTAKPEQLSINELDTIIKHQKSNQLKTDKYELIYWKRFSVPLSALVMLIIAMPFLFGSSRGGGTGQRVFFGIVVGIVFFLFNRAINELGFVYGFSPILSAFFPSLLFFIGGVLLLSRIR